MPTASTGWSAFRVCFEALEEAVRNKGRPFLGICVGMQLLSERGLEFAVTEGSGWIKGEVRAIEPNDPALKIPHMGWNTLNVVNAARAARRYRDGARRLARLFRALVSPCGRKSAASSSPRRITAAPITALVADGNIAGTQFHPEKSQKLGLKLIANFLAGSRRARLARACRALVHPSGHERARPG